MLRCRSLCCHRAHQQVPRAKPRSFFSGTSVLWLVSSLRPSRRFATFATPNVVFPAQAGTSSHCRKRSGRKSANGYRSASGRRHWVGPPDAIRWALLCRPWCSSVNCLSSRYSAANWAAGLLPRCTAGTSDQLRSRRMPSRRFVVAAASTVHVVVSMTTP